MKRFILISTVTIVCVFCFSAKVFAQNKIRLKGIVRDVETNEPLIYASIALVDLEIVTMSDENGEFNFPLIPAGNHKLIVTYIGYAEYSNSFALSEDIELKIGMKRESLGLREVVVSAENSESGATSSIIKSQAISHIQASGLRDILQLVPGNISENTNLSEPGRINIREIGTDLNSALGTAIIIDNIPLSNDGNMQQSIETLNGITSVAGTGIDLRSIAVENIESVTVDIGIPSAEHGNLTSGAVHIQTKSGGSPYNVKLQADAHTKQAYLGKGYLLKDESGVVNFDFGYTQSYQHLVKQTDLYKRINGSAKYSNTFFRKKSPLLIDLKLNLLNSFDGEKWDPDMILEEKHYSRDRELQTNFATNWMPDKTFLTSLSLDFGFNKTWQKGFEKTWEQSSSGPTFFTTATKDGEYEISYGPSAYYSEVTYDGKPFNIYSKLKAKISRKTGSLTNNILLGAEWRTTGNNGKGRIFNSEKPPAGIGSRPRPFTNIPSLNQFSLFWEDKIRVEIGLTELNVMAGLRMDNFQPRGIFTSNGSISVDPRVNIRYEILNKNNNSLFNSFCLRAGYGQTTKAPTLIHLYPDKKYNDVESFNYYPDLIVYTTDVVEDTRNNNLKPSTGNKYETGIDFQISNTTGRITLFYEKFTDGFVPDQIFYPLHYRNYNTVDMGLHPFYVPGEGIFFEDKNTGKTVTVEFENDEKFASYSHYQNAENRIKKGIEYSLSTGTIKAIRTSFNISGAWFYTESYSMDAPYWERVYYSTYAENTSTQESFAVKFKDRFGYGNVAQRLNSSINIINHFPELRMLISLNTQVIWFEKDKRKLYPGQYNFYTLSKLRNYLENPQLFQDEKEENYYYFLPESYKFYDDIEHQYTIQDFEEPMHQNAIKKMPRFRFEEEIYPVLVKCDIKISKDIGDHFTLSFYANNFLNIRPWYLTKREGRYIRRNQVPYFGADIKMQF